MQAVFFRDKHLPSKIPERLSGIGMEACKVFNRRVETNGALRPLTATSVPFFNGLPNWNILMTSGSPIAPINAGRSLKSWFWGMKAMTCRDTIHLICWYLEGKLAPPAETAIKRHLDRCPDCHVVLETAITTLDQYFDMGHHSKIEAPTPLA
ncbi:MAG: zf-HC2 domain-containing protein [Acidobacteriia bacterium]|nr:zf-HC2 domain-containing protein [Terriglobia bacterium]